MPLWGKTNTTTAKPKYLSYKDEGDVYADPRGWVKAVKNPDGSTKSEEVLVAISGLSDAIGGATPTAVYLDKDAYEIDDVVTLTVEYDEELQFTGTINATNLTATGVKVNNVATTFAYASGLDANKEGNKLNFTKTLDASVGHVLKVEAVTVVLTNITVADNTGTGTVDLEATTAELSGAGGTGAYADITLTAAT
tara:strand:- start:992 stop:1576 length:585 start_codon:yes stop_codon:yes gene_type:complete